MLNSGVSIDQGLHYVAGLLEQAAPLTGQVFREQGSKVGMTRVPISLISGKNELVRTSTNQFGEFYLEHESADKNLQVSLEVNSEKDVFIPLDESIWRIARQVK